MIPGIRRPPISHKRKAVALMVAGAIDFMQIVLFPLFGEGAISPLNDIADFAAAIALTAVCGFKWQFILAFFAELIPGLDLLPTWSAVALLIPSIPDQPLQAGPPSPSATQYPVLEGKAVVIPPVQPPPAETLPDPASP
jgi:hypothetical protein